MLLIKPFGGSGAAVSTAISFAVIALVRMSVIDEIRDLHLINFKVVFAFLLLIIESIVTYIDLRIEVRILVVLIVLFLYKAEFLKVYKIAIKMINKRKR